MSYLSSFEGSSSMHARLWLTLLFYMRASRGKDIYAALIWPNSDYWDQTPTCDQQLEVCRVDFYHMFISKASTMQKMCGRGVMFFHNESGLVKLNVNTFILLSKVNLRVTSVSIDFSIRVAWLFPPTTQHTVFFLDEIQANEMFMSSCHQMYFNTLSTLIEFLCRLQLLTINVLNNVVCITAFCYEIQFIH